MKTKLLAIVLLLSGLAAAQTAMTSTTITNAITPTQRSFIVGSATGFTASSGSGTYIAYVDKEAMKVTGVSSTLITVSRGWGGTQAVGHAASAVIVVGTADRFIDYDRQGTCTAASEYPNYTPLINIKNGKRFECISSQWREVASGADASSIIFEGATNDAYETTVTVADPTADRTWTIPDAASDTFVGKATTDTLTNKTLTNPTVTTGTFTSPSITTDIRASTAGSPSIGTAPFPFGSLIVGTAATNVFTFTPAALSAARAITVADPGGAATVAYTNPTTEQTLTNTVVSTSASVAGGAKLKLATGTAPTTTVAGDVWHDSTARNVAVAPVAGEEAYLSGTVYTLTSPVTATNPSSIADLMDWTAPANFYNAAGRVVKICGGGTYTTAAGQTPTITITWATGGVAPLAIVTAATTASSTTIPWQACAYLTTITAGASGTFETGGHLMATLGATAAAAAAVYQGTNTAVSSAVDQTGTLATKMRVTMSSSDAGNSVIQRWGYVQIVK